MITSPEQAIAEAIRTGKSVEVHRADGSVRVVVSIPREDLPCPICDESTKCKASESLRASLAERNAQLDAVRNAIAAECVEHVELNGHLDLAEQCHDWLAHEIVDEGDPSGRLGEFVESLRIVIDQCDRQRRRANWYEAAYTAGKQKLIESAVARVEKERDELQRAHDFEAQRSNHYKALHGSLMTNYAALSDERDAYRAMLADLVGVHDEHGDSHSGYWEAARDLLKHGPNANGANDE